MRFISSKKSWFTAGIRRPILFILLIAIIAIHSSCVSKNTSNPNSRTEDIPMDIVDLKSGEFISLQNLIDRLERKEILLLGEKHDNERSHLLRAQILQLLAKKTKSFAIVWEHFDRGVYPVLRGKSIDEIDKEYNWTKSGWPKIQIFEPLIKFAQENAKVNLGAGLPRSQLMSLFKPGASVGKYDPEKYDPRKSPIGENALEKLKKQIIASHCNHASPKMVEKMVLVQQKRDELIALKIGTGKSLLPRSAGLGENKIVFLGGNGHIRKDYGVPRYLDQKVPNSFLSIAFLPLPNNENEGLKEAFQRLDAKEELAGEKYEAYDFAVLTSLVDRKDPCEAFIKYMKKKNKKP